MSLADRSDSLLISSLADASEATRSNLARLRELATSDQTAAKRVEREAEYFASIQEAILTANRVFELIENLAADLHEFWYELDGPYDPAQEASLIEKYRRCTEGNEEVFIGIERCGANGRALEGADVFLDNVRKAWEVVEEEEVRKEAERMMPSIERLDAIAAAHRHSIGE